MRMTLKFSERIITVEKQYGKIICSGSIERETAHQSGIRHLTVIVVPFVPDGKDQGKWLVHNRRDKQLAKGLSSPEFSYNLFGGHCNPPEEEDMIIGKEIGKDLLLDSAVREMSEELFIRDDRGRNLEVFGSDGFIRAIPYPVREDQLIPLGYADFDDSKDAEYSFYFALPVSAENIESYVAADDYIREDSCKGNVALPISLKSERELYALYQQNNSDIEICNAISRLWEPQNSTLLSKIRQITNQI